MLLIHKKKYFKIVTDHHHKSSNIYQRPILIQVKSSCLIYIPIKQLCSFWQTKVKMSDQ
jgi:hypothetical protein